MSAREAESGLRETRDTCEVVVLGTKKHIRPKAITKEKDGTTNTKWRNTKGDRKEVVAKSKLEMLVGEPVLEEKISAKEDNSAR